MVPRRVVRPTHHDHPGVRRSVSHGVQIMVAVHIQRRR